MKTILNTGSQQFFFVSLSSPPPPGCQGMGPATFFERVFKNKVRKPPIFGPPMHRLSIDFDFVPGGGGVQQKIFALRTAARRLINDN